RAQPHDHHPRGRRREAPGDDAEHTIFYTLALASWGLQMFVFYRAYDAFDAYNERVDAQAVNAAPATA
ncbi:hypothetical protein P1N98_13530, partial [Tsukamurella tyrosinosolvens]